jgi:hypothetical protein
VVKVTEVIEELLEEGRELLRERIRKIIRGEFGEELQEFRANVQQYESIVAKLLI